MPCDYDQYPKDWKEIRQRILARAGNTCERCGLPNYGVIESESRELLGPAEQEVAIFVDGIKTTKVVLTVAHLNHNTKDNTDENLQALCQKCHLDHDKEQHAESRRRNREAKLGPILPGLESIDPNFVECSCCGQWVFLENAKLQNGQELCQDCAGWGKGGEGL